MSKAAAIDRLFNPRRLFLLLRRDFAHGYRGVLTAMAAVGGTMILFSLLSMIGSRGGDFYTPFYLGLLVLGGLIFSASVFREMHQTGSGPFYLTLPGTLLEKFTSKLLVSSVGFAAAVLVFISAVSGVSELLNRALFGAGHAWFNPFAPANLQFAALYLVFQAMYLLGSVWFRRFAFLKTALAINVIAIGLVIVAGIIFRLMFSDLISGTAMAHGFRGLFGRDFGGFTADPQAAEKLRSGLLVFSWIARILFWATVAPVCWAAAYLRLRETEV